jgi:serine/threonine-protein kinase
MRLSAGDKLGPYEILAPIGAGGMGEVYRAHDTRLRRDVAIKVSVERFSERFEKEARAIASLNHPNVCTLYDVGPNYLVMELVEGQTLAERIKQRAIPIDEALGIAKQIADALEAAHEKGITHRDLKPGNIHIKPDGTVKVLDFGLAKIGGTPTAQPDDSPTLTAGPTQAGMILGTAAYMSPEQARGKEVDRRADIWAFGVVLYEMLTGQKLFEGDDLSETLASVIKEQPRLERVPAKVQRLLRSCLEKDPKQRLQAIGDWRMLLEDQAPPAKDRATKLPWAVAAVLSVALGIAVWQPWRAEPVDRPLARLDVDLGANVSLPSTVSGSGVAISPDGTRLAYTSGAPPKLFTRRLDQPKATELPGTEYASGPFFSPDGQWVGFEIFDRLNKISVEGGAVVPLGDIASATFAGASWGEDGSILLSEGWTKGLLRIRAGGGRPEAVAGLGSGELSLALPQLLPGGKAILFSAQTVPDVDKFTIEVLTLADGHRKIVARGGQCPRYLPTSGRAGHLIYVNKATLFAIPFDLDRLETAGTAVPVLDDVADDASFQVAQFDFSRTGTLVYRRATGGGAAMRTVQWVDPTGRREPLLAKPGKYSGLSLSPDGKRLALVITEGGSQDVWVYDPQRDAMTRLTSGGAFYSYTRWSPDGQYVVFSSHGNGIFYTRADGASQPQALTQGKTAQFPWSFTPDGKRLAYDDLGDGHWQIWTVPLEDQGGRLKAGTPEQLKSSFTELNPVFSPDGRWLAYESVESERGVVYVRQFPPSPSGQSGKWQISNGGGGWAHWSRNGHELVYQSGDQMMAASYTAKGNTFVAEKPRVWIAKLGGRAWDLAPDGKRVLVLTPVESAEPKQEHEVVMLLNFFDELRRKAPTGK